MSNTFSQFKYGINIFATFTYKGNKTTTIVLSIFIIFIMAIIYLIFSSIEMSDFGSSIFLLIFLAFIFFGTLKYLLWNINGQELLIINTKSISYHYNYGGWLTNARTIKYNMLEMRFSHHRIENEIEMGYFEFYDYRVEDNLPVLIHKTTISIDRERYEELNDAIIELFSEQQPEPLDLLNYSMN